MTESQRAWSSARDGLVAAVTSLGFSAELAELMAAQAHRFVAVLCDAESNVVVKGIKRKSLLVDTSYGIEYFERYHRAGVDEQALLVFLL